MLILSFPYQMCFTTSLKTYPLPTGVKQKEVDKECYFTFTRVSPIYAHCQSPNLEYKYENVIMKCDLGSLKSGEEFDAIYINYGKFDREKTVRTSVKVESDHE